MDDITNRPKGFAFVEYQMPENAVKVLSELDGTSFMGRLLHVIPGKEKLISRSAEFTPKHDPTLNTSYKKVRRLTHFKKVSVIAFGVSFI
jgi:RNA recognition motif-containing protein